MIEQLIEKLISEGKVSRDEVERRVKEHKDRLENPTFDYEGLTLAEAKEQKTRELSSACKETILGHFKSTLANAATYSFSYDGEAQANFNKVGRAFDKALITSVSWTAYDSTGKIVRVTLDATDFNTVFKDSLGHVSTNISKFRDTLMPKVEGALTVSDVEAIVW